MTVGNIEHDLESLLVPYSSAMFTWSIPREVPDKLYSDGVLPATTVT